MKEVLRTTYQEIHVPAEDFAAFLQHIHTSRRVGTLTISIGTGGVPCGVLVWREQVLVTLPNPPEPVAVESTVGLHEFISLR